MADTRRVGPSESGARKLGAPVDGRDLFLDFARNFALLGVVACHFAIYLRPWNEAATTFELIGVQDEGYGWIGVFFIWMMPAFFFVGGALAYRSARSVSGAAGVLQFITRRLWRIVIPVLALFVVLWVLNAVIRITWDPEICRANEGTADGRLGFECTTALPVAQLWFLLLYIPLVIVSPLLARIWARIGWKLILVPIGLLAVSGVMLIARGSHPGIGLLGLASFSVPWLIGFAYADGRLLQMSRRGVVVIGVAAFGLYLGGLAVTSLPAVLVLQPQTLVTVSGAIAGLALLLLLRDPISRWCRESSVGGWLTGWVSTRLMTIYVWHLAAMFLTYGVFVLAGYTFADHLGWHWIAERPFVVLAPVIPLVFLVKIFGPIEDIKAPGWLIGTKRRTRPARDADVGAGVS